VLAAEHLLDLGRLDFLLERFDRSLEIAGDVLALLRPFEQDSKIVEFADQRVAQIELLAQTAAPLERLLRLDLVLPEVGRSDTLLDNG
jgi:hypothetical protein